MSKMGISTLQSYCGAQIFEAIGLEPSFVDRYFTWTASRIGGVGIDVIAQEVKQRHERAFPTAPSGRGGPRIGRRVQMAPGWRAASLQPGDRPEAAACDAYRPVLRVPGVHRDRQRPEPGARHSARTARLQGRLSAGASRGSRARRSHPQALRDRRDVVRLDQPGGPRDDCHRHESARRQVEHR